MSVKYSLIRKNEDVAANREQTACFGDLKNQQSHNDNSQSGRAQLCHVKYWPAKWHDDVPSQAALLTWYRHLLSLPFVLDSLREVPDLRHCGEDRWFVKVRTDIPADRMMNVLALFRYPYVGQSSVLAFSLMVGAEIDPKIAFVIAVGVVSHERASLSLAARTDTEHSFVNQVHLTLKDAKGMATSLQGDDWEGSYNGLQPTFNSTGKYVRGEGGVGTEGRLTAFAGPSIGHAPALKSEHLCMPWLAWHLLNPSRANSARAEGVKMSDCRSLPNLSLSNLLDISTWFEDKINE